MIAYIRTQDGLTIFDGLKQHNVASTNPYFDQIVNALNSRQYDLIPSLLSPIETIKTQFGEDTGITVTPEKVVVFRGKPIRGVLMERILDMIRDNFDLMPIAHFLNNLYDNPSADAIERMYGWLEANQFALTEDGCFVAYKRVRDDYASFHDGTTMHKIGEVISMPRERCDTNSDNTCSTGLHFCSYNYLSVFNGGSGRVLVLKINPRDVTAIPTDYNNAKGRACQYMVMADLSAEKAKAVEHRDVMPQVIITEQTDVNVSEQYAMGYADGYKDGRAKKATGTTSRLEMMQDATQVSDYQTGYTAGRKDGRDRKAKLYHA